FPDATKSAAVHQYPYGGAPAEAREQLEVYPNPAADYLIIKWMLEHPDASGTVQIAGLDGRIVSGFPLNGSVGQQVIATSGLKPGVYVVSAFVDKQQVATKKVSIYR
ncbi:MAG: T9SS type A sorting domain-containing protein, partial [Clostridia bacterium]|nr:T9SS type A sorting domain-containing protein [Clostridia bacterium]